MNDAILISMSLSALVIVFKVKLDRYFLRMEKEGLQERLGMHAIQVQKANFDKAMLNAVYQEHFQQVVAGKLMWENIPRRVMISSFSLHLHGIDLNDHEFASVMRCFYGVKSVVGVFGTPWMCSIRITEGHLKEIFRISKRI